MVDQVVEKLETEVVLAKHLQDLVSEGFRYYWCREYKLAVKTLARAIAKVAKEHGETHDALGNIYLFYGKSLLELTRETDDPLGDAVPKLVPIGAEEGEGEGEDGEAEEEDQEDEEEEDNDDDDDTSSDEEEKVSEAANGEEKKKNGVVPEEKNDADTCSEESILPQSSSSQGETTTPSESSSEKPPVEHTQETAENDESSDGEDKEEAEDDQAESEEPSDLQLAWEVLELAKSIFIKRGESGKADYAECLVTLGEVAVESGNMSSAIADIKEGLAIQEEIRPGNNAMRLLAHSHYMLAIALAADNQIEESINAYQKTLDLLKQRLATLEAETKDGVSDKEETIEIKTLIPQVEEKIVDLQSYNEESAKDLAAALIPEEQPATQSSPEKKATDISHLVKRKREKDDGDAANAVKKPATDITGNCVVKPDGDAANAVKKPATDTPGNGVVKPASDLAL